MAVVGVHRMHLAWPTMWILLAGICDTIQLIGWQDDDIVMYRLLGKELPKEDNMITLHISYFPGIEPFVDHI